MNYTTGEMSSAPSTRRNTTAAREERASAHLLTEALVEQPALEIATTSQALEGALVALMECVDDFAALGMEMQVQRWVHGGWLASE